MPKNWHHFSAKEHRKFLEERGFLFIHQQGSHLYFAKRVAGHDCVVQVVLGKEEHRQSRKTMDMSSRHSGISKREYAAWINE